MKTGIESIFLTYANLTLKDKPESLIKVFEVAEEYEHLLQIEGKAWIMQAIEFMKVIEKYDLRQNPDLCEIAKDDLYKEKDSYEWQGEHGDFFGVKNPREAAIESLTHPLIDCEHCDFKGGKKLWKKFNLNEPRCYLCTQAMFKNFLSSIVNGFDYFDIFYHDYFSVFITTEPYLSYHSFVDVDEVDPNKSKLKMYSIYEIDQGSNANIEVIKFSSFALLDFLVKNDRRKLKFCPYCNKFYTAKNINRKTRCYSKDCEKSYQRDKKRKQRKEEPEIYC